MCSRAAVQAVAILDVHELDLLRSPCDLGGYRRRVDTARGDSERYAEFGFEVVDHGRTRSERVEVYAVASAFQTAFEHVRHVSVKKREEQARLGRDLDKGLQGVRTQRRSASAFPAISVNLTHLDGLQRSLFVACKESLHDP